MSRRVFFSFYYGNDIWRVNQVRQSSDLRNVAGDDTFYDNALWQQTKKQGDAALQALIDDGLRESSVTVVLAAAETWKRPWVRYELLKSFERGNGLMTVWIHKLNGGDGRPAAQGLDPMDCLWFVLSSKGESAETHYYDGITWHRYETIDAANLPPLAKRLGRGRLSALAAAHVWVPEGPNAFTTWIEDAAVTAGR